MKVIIGLGNPGKEYENTRHNAGYFIVEKIQKEWGFEEFKASKFFGLVSEGVFKGEKIILLKPTTYMNLSGRSVLALLQFYKLAPESILVLSDDLDMEFGKTRFRGTGSSGGQNGLKSIAESIGNTTFSRCKIGIGRDEKYNVSDWVLSRFKKEELDILHADIWINAEKIIQSWILGEI